MTKEDNLNQQVTETLSEKMKQWRATNPKATLTEIEEAVDRELNQLRQQLVENLAPQTELASEQACPQCAAKDGQERHQEAAVEQ